MGWIARRARRRLSRWWRPVSAGYELLDPAHPPEACPPGWLEPAVALSQERAYAPLMRDLEQGRPRQDFVAAAAAARDAGVDAARVLEIGCGGAHYARVLERLAPAGLRQYWGLDRSPHMLALARRRAPQGVFVLGDATRLPFADRAFDIVLDGGALLHVAAWRRSLAETARVARRAVILHQVPLVQGRPSALLRKRAYGGAVLEWVWSEPELRSALEAVGLRVERSYHCAAYDLSAYLGAPTELRTFLCGVSTVGAHVA